MQGITAAVVRVTPPAVTSAGGKARGIGKRGDNRDVVKGPFGSIQDVFLLAAKGQLPDGFRQWDLCDSNGYSVAHVAAQFLKLPKHFHQWDIALPNGWSVAHEAARSGALPFGFVQWTIAMPDGWSVAHEAAKSGHLPLGFSRWRIADQNGWTVAHEAAWARTLPLHFALWEIDDGRGWTVAHVAAMRGCLPVEKWEELGGLTDKRGCTVKQLIQSIIHERMEPREEKWELEKWEYI